MTAAVLPHSSKNAAILRKIRGSDSSGSMRHALHWRHQAHGLGGFSSVLCGLYTPQATARGMPLRAPPSRTGIPDCGLNPSALQVKGDIGETVEREVRTQLQQAVSLIPKPKPQGIPHTSIPPQTPLPPERSSGPTSPIFH